MATWLCKRDSSGMGQSVSPVCRGPSCGGLLVNAAYLSDSVLAEPQLLQLLQRLQALDLPDLIGAQLQQPQACQVLHCLHGMNPKHVVGAPCFDMLLSLGLWPTHCRCTRRDAAAHSMDQGQNIRASGTPWTWQHTSIC